MSTQRARLLYRLLTERKTRQQGITLVELLVSLVISLVVLSAAVGAVVAYWRYAAGVEARNRLQDQWGQVNFLLSSEIAEADEFSTAGICSGTGSLLTLEIPNADGSDARSQVRYSVNAADALVRCGPPFDLNGGHDFGGTPIESNLVANAALTVQLPTNRTPIYTLTLNDPATGASYTNQVSSSRARVRIIND